MNDMKTTRRRARWAARASVPVVLLLGVPGCANVAVEGGAGGVAGTPPAARAAADGAASSLDQDVLLKLLVAEMAGQRGQIDVAVANYLEVARLTRDPAIAERAVRIAVFARDEARGLEAAKVWSEVAVDNPDARRVYAALLLRAGRIDEAVAEFEALVSGADPSGESFGKVADALSREKNRVAAIAVMERLLASRENDARALFAFAQLLARAGELERATGVLERLLAIEPGNERAVVSLARLHQRENKTAAAIEVLARYLASNPESDEVRMAYARLLVDARRYEDARREFETLAERTPSDADVSYALGLLLLQTNRNEEAAERFRRLIELGERTQEAHYYLGQIAETAEDYEAALAAYRKVTEGENRLNAQIRVAVLMAELGDVPGARAFLQGLRSDNLQEAVRIFRAEAELLTRRDRLEEGLAVYDAALEQYPENTDLLYARAMLAEKLDRLDVLESDLRSIISREPNNADALNALGYTLADRTERYEEALELIERAHELKPDDHYIVDSLGWIMYRLGRYDDALRHLRRAMALKGDAEIAAHLGEVLWVTGDREEAKRVWRTALEATPDDKKLLDVIKRFGL